MSEHRRGFLAQAITLVLGGLALLVPAGAGLVALLNPLRQKSSGVGFVRLTTLDTLPGDGTPRKFPVLADRTDAWNLFPEQPIGGVFLRRTGKNQVVAYNVMCPHLGCTIQYETSADGGKFFCPCHSASFALDGERLDKTSPSPRDMDSLEVKIENGTEVWVDFKNFETGTPKKIAKT
jgi:menaquinol-cytochrome c reductase iron-sulfur subunit